MFEQEKISIIEAGKKLDRYGLVTLSGGNVTLRMPTGEILVTPSGMIYEDMVPEDVLVMDIEGNIIEGEMKTICRYCSAFVYFEAYARSECSYSYPSAICNRCGTCYR